jgi:hypothetical protein
MENEVYVVEAYRGGNVKEHRYTVGADMDIDLAKTLADEEAVSRSGKYGICVFKYLGRDREVCYYVPSRGGEEHLYSCISSSFCLSCGKKLKVKK